VWVGAVRDGCDALMKEGAGIGSATSSTRQYSLNASGRGRAPGDVRVSRVFRAPGDLRIVSPSFVLLAAADAAGKYLAAVAAAGGDKRVRSLAFYAESLLALLSTDRLCALILLDYRPTNVLKMSVWRRSSRCIICCAINSH